MFEPDPSVEEWATLSRLLDQVLELPHSERARWIDSLSAEHDAIRPRLRRLLSEGASVASSSFLQTVPKLDAIDGSLPDDEDDAERPPASVGPYSIVRKLSEGGMGTVWLARRTDAMMNRLVALKLPRGGGWGVGLAERMANEREILSALNHPNIARLYDAGVDGSGQPYLALEYVTGRPIDEYVKANQLPIRARLHLFLQMARAVAHAHSRLIVHRDLKPSNILVTDDGDVKLLDFGIAKLLDDGGRGAAITSTTGRHFTPDYASPEQITGNALGTATDVYSSGVLLYELLTGARPYTLRGASRGALEDAIVQVDPRRPSAAAPDQSTRRALRGDLDTIVLKALKKRPEERYATIDGLAEDIERHLRNLPVLARPDRTWYRLSKSVARNKFAFGAAAAMLMAILAGSGLAAWQARVALTEKARAEDVRDFLLTLFRDASPYNTRGRAAALDWLKQARSRIDHRLDDRPALRVELLNMMGSSLITLQDTDGANELLTQAIDEGTRRLGPDHPQTIRARVLMMHVHRFRGQTAESRAEVDRLLPVLRAGGDLLLEDLVIALKHQAHLEVDAGRYDRAERAAEEAVDLSLRRLGPEHPETVAVLLTRAYVYQFSREADVSLEASSSAYRTTLAIYQDAPRHPRIIEARLLYGRALGEAGMPARSVEHLAQAVAEAADVFGPSSRMVGLFSLPLAESQAETGRVTQAIENSEKALAIIAQHTTPHSFKYVAAVHQRGAALLSARRPEAALPDLAGASAALRQTLPRGHSVTRWFEADYGLALARAGKPGEASELIASLLPGGTPQPADSSASRALYAMGVARRLAGDAGAALRYQDLALESLARAGGAELRRMRALTERGLALLDLARPEDAARPLEEALALSREWQTHTAPDRADILVGLGRAQLALGRIAPGCEALRTAHAFWSDFDPGNRDARDAARWLARCRAP
jgi:serine/threonine-protein kinase